MAKSFKIIKLVSEFWNTTAPISHCLLSSNFKSTASTGHYLGVEGDQLVVQIDCLYRTMDTILKETNLLSKSTVSTWQSCCPNRAPLLDNGQYLGIEGDQLVFQIDPPYWTTDNGQYLGVEGDQLVVHGYVTPSLVGELHADVRVGRCARYHRCLVLKT